QLVTNLAADSGVHATSVFRRRASFSDGKAAVLQAKLTPGRAPKVSEKELRWTASAARGNTQRQFNFDFGLWTLALMRELINRQFGKSSSLESVRRPWKLFDLSVPKPSYLAWHWNAE